MRRRLYVGNLPASVDAASLRAHFGSCGAVSDVTLTADRNAGRGRGTASIEMGSEAAARRAIAELNGSLFGGQLLLVEPAPDEAQDAGRGRKQEEPDQVSRARITMQFREPTNMTYELDCDGTILVLSIYFPLTEGSWRILARVSRSLDGPSTSSTAASRIEALRGLAGACGDRAAGDGFALIDWTAVEQEMKRVRAV